MAVNRVLHTNECGLPLNAVEWLETHHASKIVERSQMVRDLCVQQGSLIVDAGCGPGLWTPLLAEATGPQGHIIGVDINPEALVTAQKRSSHAWYRHQVQYKCATLEQLPLEYGEVDIIFSANVSQYLPHPVETFAAMGRYLKPGGRLAIKDIDFGTLHFANIDQALQRRVFEARQRWELERPSLNYSFEDSWVGSKLAGYLAAAGYQEIEERKYRVVRSYPLQEAFRTYLQGLGEWFVCEGAPYLSDEDVTRWLQCFLDPQHNIFNAPDCAFEETEYLVTGIWKAPRSRFHFEMHAENPLVCSSVK